MDSQAVSKVFRRLLSHEICSRVRYRPSINHNGRPLSASRSMQVRHDSTGNTYTPSKSKQPSSPDVMWQMRTDSFPEDKLSDWDKYPWVTARELRERKQRPRRVRMLMREFIEDSLYNPHYGYFSKQAVIFTPGKPFDFVNMKDEHEFHRKLGERYTSFEDKLDENSPNETRQLWHTPTELFKPYYGEAIARFMVENYQLMQYPYHDLIIYEMGAGNGTMMLNILDHIRDEYPHVYERTKFKVIEISEQLATLQNSNLMRTARSKGHKDHVEIINKSVFDWDTYVPEPCWFLALEVFDNFAHDAIRYDPITERPLQGTVMIDSDGEFYEFYIPVMDSLAERYLKARDVACDHSYDHPLKGSRLLRQAKYSLPFAHNLTLPEYIPTRLMQFFDILASHFPMHRLLTSDFHYLPDAIKGYNAPVVQTRFRRRTIPVTTPLVQQGYFDILFPTNFTVMEDLYRAITGKLTRVSSHEEFLRQWADHDATLTKSGENPMLSWYKNASMMATV